MSLQTQYRPSSFKTFVGNTDVVEGLGSVLERENPPAAFLFTGPGGTGKTTLGRIVKNMLKCADSDFKELNAADDRGIDAIRKLIEQMRFTPMGGDKKVFLLDEAHMLTKPSQEALLKALEEPPSYVHWIICTTNPEALKPTFKRRCHAYELEQLMDKDLITLIRRVVFNEFKNEKERAKSFPREVVEKIIEMCDGSAGQALKLLDMVIDMEDPKRALNTLRSAGAGETEVITMCRVLCSQDVPKTKWGRMKKLLKNYKGDGESARRPILGYLNSILLNRGGDDIFMKMEPFKKNFFDSGKAGLSMAMYEAIFSED